MSDVFFFILLFILSVYRIGWCMNMFCVKVLRDKANYSMAVLDVYVSHVVTGAVWAFDVYGLRL